MHGSACSASTVQTYALPEQQQLLLQLDRFSVLWTQDSRLAESLLFELTAGIGRKDRGRQLATACMRLRMEGSGGAAGLVSGGLASLNVTFLSTHNDFGLRQPGRYRRGADTYGMACPQPPCTAHRFTTETTS